MSIAAAKSLIAQRVAKRYDYALQTMKDVRYVGWRNYDPEDAIRFYTLRLHEIGVIKATPQKIIAPGHRLALPQRAEEGAEGVVGHVTAKRADGSRSATSPFGAQG